MLQYIANYLFLQWTLTGGGQNGPSEDFFKIFNLPRRDSFRALIPYVRPCVTHVARKKRSGKPYL